MTYVLERRAVRAYAFGVPTLGQNIRRIRLASGFTTQKELARAMGRDSSQLVSDWETDRRDALNMNSLLLFAKTCRVTIDDVIVGIDDEYDQMRSKLMQAAATTLVPESEDEAGVSSAPSLSQAAVDAATISSLKQKLNDLKTKYDELHDDVEGTIEHLSHHVGAKITTAGTKESTPRRHGKKNAG